MAMLRAQSVSTFTIVKGALIDETYAAFVAWDFALSRAENLHAIARSNTVGAPSEGWLGQTLKVLRRRFDPAGRDRPLAELAKAGCPREVWRPLLLWHLTRDEFLVRDFLVSWLYPRFLEGATRLRARDVLPYLAASPRVKTLRWSVATTERIATGLLRLAADFGLLRGRATKELVPYHLPEESFLYLLHALGETCANAEKLIAAPDWQMYLLGPAEVEREILRLHQFHRLRYEVAGSLAQLSLPHAGSADFARSWGRVLVS